MTEKQTCPACSGKGNLSLDTTHVVFPPLPLVDCPTCHGTGKVDQPDKPKCACPQSHWGHALDCPRNPYTKGVTPAEPASEQQSRPVTNQEIMNGLYYSLGWDIEYLDARNDPERRRFLEDNFNPEWGISDPKAALEALSNKGGLE